MTNHLRYRDTDDRFKAATDAQLAAWEADQPQPIQRCHSLLADVKEFLAAVFVLFVAAVVLGSGYFGSLMGWWS